MTGLLDIFFPPGCLACAELLEENRFFCPRCDVALERMPSPHCLRCAEPGTFGSGGCSRCLARPPPFRRAYAPFAHEGPIARAIHQFKYEDHPELSASLATLLVENAKDFLSAAPSAVCALPLHAKRFRHRKYDQAQLLARDLARRTGRQLRVNALTRVRETNRQVGLSETERESNVQGAFEAEPKVSGLSLLLIDDVFTTGSTARAASQALLDAGAREVQVLTLARAFLTT